MKPQSSPSAGTNSRRGSRRPRRRSNSSERNSSSFGRSRYNSAPVAKPTLWEKFIALFTGKKKSAAPASSNRGDRTFNRFESSTAAPRSVSSRTRESGSGEPKSSERKSARKPEMVEVTNARLYVGNLSYDATESDLSELFNGVGRVVNVEVISFRHNQRSKGFGFVQMQSIDEAMRAVAELHDKEFFGRKLFVSGAKSVEPSAHSEDSNESNERSESVESQSHYESDSDSEPTA